MQGMSGFTWLIFGAVLIAGSKMFNAQSAGFYQIFYYLGILFAAYGLIKLLWKIRKIPRGAKGTTNTKKSGPSIIHCHDCGTKNHDVSNFCHKCGAKLRNHPQEHFSAKP